MGLFDKFIKKDKPEEKSHNKNFNHLYGLIHSGVKEIILDSDITLDDSEAFGYIKGVEIDIDGITIDGNGRTVDAKNKARIFNITARDITIKNIIFINGSSSSGGAIINQSGDADIVDCKFRDNSAEHGGAITNFSHLNVTGCRFSRNVTTKANGGAINNQNGGVLEIADCEFEDNDSCKYAGAIVNFSQISLKNCIFKNNHANGSGAIFNQEGSFLEALSCEFKNNSANLQGGALINFGDVDFRDCLFSGNDAGDNGGAINNQRDGVLDVVDCEFRGNSTKSDGGAIINFQQVSLRGCLFADNDAGDNGGAISNQYDGIVAVDCEFKDNTTHNSGGAIINFANLNLKECSFCNNEAKRANGGAIKNLLNSSLYCENSEFIGNHSNEEGEGIYNDSNDAKLINCNFSQHGRIYGVAVNKNSLIFIDCTFKDNNLHYVLMNSENARLEISGGEFIDNEALYSIIYNCGECSVDNTSFKTIDSYEIRNESNLYLNSPKFTRDDSVFNVNHIEIRNLPHKDVERFIENRYDGYVDEFDVPDEIKSDFSYLDELIKEQDEISLSEDIVLENYEYIFFEGGINLDKDNIVIDGNGHAIDAKNKTRIFNISGKNIVLKNIIFKNGALINNFDEHSSGGGSIKITRTGSAVIENCQFIENSSQDDGGAILNNGTLRSVSNKFINNSSQYNGGAICNNNELCTCNDTFNENKSRIAGAVYNNGRLTITENIFLSNNSSDFKQPIYNANSIKLDNTPSKTLFILISSIYDTFKVSKKFSNNWGSFKDLNKKFEDSNEISLKNDIKMQYEDITSTIINIDEDLILEGNEHIIDMNNLNIHFKINANVVFRNITFKNGYISDNPFFEVNKAIQFENVKFLNMKITNDNHLITNNDEAKIINSNFYNNYGKNGFLILNDGDLEIINTNFINNHTHYRGIINNEIDNKQGLLIKESCFMCNSTKQSAGAVYNSQNTVSNIQSTKFIKNRSNTGGAMYNEGEANLTDCTFKSNHANGSGAIHNMMDSLLNVVNCEFESNVADVFAGAIGNWGHLKLEGGVFSNNIAETLDGGAINNQKDGTVEARKTEFSNNRGKSAGAAFTVSNDALKFYGCTFNDNWPTDINNDLFVR